MLSIDSQKFPANKYILKNPVLFSPFVGHSTQYYLFPQYVCGVTSFLGTGQSLMFGSVYFNDFSFTPMWSAESECKAQFGQEASLPSVADENSYRAALMAGRE